MVVIGRLRLSDKRIVYLLSMKRDGNRCYCVEFKLTGAGLVEK